MFFRIFDAFWQTCGNEQSISYSLRPMLTKYNCAIITSIITSEATTVTKSCTIKHARKYKTQSAKYMYLNTIDTKYCIMFPQTIVGQLYGCSIFTALS